MPSFLAADRVRESSTSTGSGNISLAGAPTGFRTFNAVMGVGPYFVYAIVHQTANEWEVGVGYLSASTTLVRNTLISSSSGSTVSFSAGTKDVFITQAANLDANKVNLGTNANILGSFATSVGNATSTTGSYSTAVGYSTTASGTQSTAVGFQAYSTSTSSTAVGWLASATNSSATALGDQANASNQYSIALGYQAGGTGDSAISIGRASDATQQSAVALGYNAQATNIDALAVGSSTSAAGTAAIAIGNGAQATSDYGISLGSGTNSANTAISIGLSANTTNTFSTAIGYSASAAGNSSIAQGFLTNAASDYSIAIGRQAYSQNNYSIAIGFQTNSRSEGAVAIGQQVTVSTGSGSEYSIGIGYGAVANPGTGPTQNAVALGRNASVYATNAVAVGQFSRVAQPFSFGGYDGVAVGSSAVVDADNGVAIGANASVQPGHNQSVVLGFASSQAPQAFYVRYIRNTIPAVGTQYSLVWDSSTYEITGTAGGGGGATSVSFIFEANTGSIPFISYRQNVAFVASPGVGQWDVVYTTAISFPSGIEAAATASLGDFNTPPYWCAPGTSSPNAVRIYVRDSTWNLAFPPYPARITGFVPQY